MLSTSPAAKTCSGFVLTVCLLELAGRVHSCVWSAQQRLRSPPYDLLCSDASSLQVGAASASSSGSSTPRAVFDAPAEPEDIYANPPSLMSTLTEKLQPDIQDPALRWAAAAAAVIAAAAAVPMDACSSTKGCSCSSSSTKGCLKLSAVCTSRAIQDACAGLPCGQQQGVASKGRSQLHVQVDCVERYCFGTTAVA
jgi:hypothetical protein